LKHEQVTFAFVGAFVDELARAGVRNVCIAPGSRSTPLALMIARQPEIKVWLNLDERSNAFFALGMAKASRDPVAILCSSGTATANFYPAVIEARLGRVPLIVLTADRPPELRDVGAPQTIDQIRLYGAYPKWSVEVSQPEATPDLLRYARTLAGRAAATARSEPAGPVHLNFPFREPLIPLPPEGASDLGDLSDPARYGREDHAPYVDVASAQRVLDDEALDELAADISGFERGLIVCGPQFDPELAGPVARLGAVLHFPVLADPLSLVRCGPHSREAVIGCYDAFLRDQALGERLRPDVVLRLGAMPTSKPVLLWLERFPDVKHIVVGEGWEDPMLMAARMVQADPRRVCQGLLERFESEPSADSGWLRLWRGVDRISRDAIQSFVAGVDEPFEGRVFAELADLMPDGATLWASSSMPVRDLDTFFPGGERRVTFLSNRGANGIDGVISSALGASTVSDGPLVLTIGDIAFYHDMNGLLAARLHGLNATIILINNDGGGIFSFLPQAGHPEHFEALFGTPHGLDFRPAADLYGGRYHLIDGWDDFRREVASALDAPGLKIIEVRTERERNVSLHREVWQAVSRALAKEPSRAAV
jgi:2-succinyl-5-enolpyruvyl-6-hydroxy-3-cyclohexene-1-carboxylate synthase